MEGSPGGCSPSGTASSSSSGLGASLTAPSSLANGLSGPGRRSSGSWLSSMPAVFFSGGSSWLASWLESSSAGVVMVGRYPLRGQGCCAGVWRSLDSVSFPEHPCCMAEVTALPARGDVFLDDRGTSRALRLSWHHDGDVVVLSLWRGSVCAGTFR